jgi:hypothetical protein
MRVMPGADGVGISKGGRRMNGGWAGRIFTSLLLGGWLAAMLAGGPAWAGADLTKYVPAPPEPGTAIPASVIKFGMRPYADNTFYFIGMKEGWFKDVGISFTPAPYGLKANDSNVTTLLLNGQLDIISEYCPLMLPTYKASKALKCIAFTDTFLANAILANPALHLKTFKDYIAQGMNFDQAIHATLAPLAGKTLVGAPELSDRPFEEGLEKFSGVRWNLEVLDDSKSLVLAKAGREEFVNPEGAPIVYTLRQAGWTDLVDIGDLFKYGPGGPQSPVEPLIDIVGVGANGNYVNTHQNTVLRFLSVVWRIIDEVKTDPALFAIQAPYLNSFAGTSLDGTGVENTVHILDPFTGFAGDAAYYDDPKATLYYKNVWGAIIADFEQHDILPKGAVTPDEVVWGSAIWHQMVGYRDQTDALMKGLAGKTLTPAQQELADHAKQFYAWHDYLDSYRLAAAAAK